MTESKRAAFLSYASQDAEAARRICAALRAAGVEACDCMRGVLKNLEQDSRYKAFLHKMSLPE